jgi:glycosyltransferase involved in cell wall biosynthesis
MNNIEIQELKRDALNLLGEKQADQVLTMNSLQLEKLKVRIHNIKQKKFLSHIEKRNEEIARKKEQGTAVEITKIIPDREVLPLHKVKIEQSEKSVKLKEVNGLLQPPKISITGKPRILLVSDVKDWAWWIKSEYLKEYLSDEFEIDITNALGNRSKRVDPMDYDIFFTYGFSFISFYDYVPKKKKVTGVTAHRRQGVIVSAMKKAGWIHANSKMLQKELRSWGFKNVFYLPNGVDENLFKPKTKIPLEEGQVTVGHVGKKAVNKGQEEYILPSIKISKAKSFLHFNDYTNSIPHKEMPAVYQNFDFYICSSYEDGTPNPALEAAACGRPILTNRIGNMPEFVVDGHNGFLVDRDIQQYVDKIRWFRTYPERLVQMGQNARKTVLEGWTWKIQSENYRKMFREILKGK